jgi:hypothetical protein
MFLTDFKILNLPRDQISEFKGKATQNNWQSLSALAEGLVARHYQLKAGIANVEFHPALQSRGTGDLSVTRRGRKIFYEITSLGTGAYEQKVEDAFDKICQAEVVRLEKRRYVELVIDLARLRPDKPGHLESDTVGAALEKFIDTLDLRALFNTQLVKRLDLDRVATLPWKDMTVYEHAHWKTQAGLEFNMLHNLDLVQLVEKAPVREWAGKITPAMVADCPISFFHAFDSTTDVPEFHIQSRLVHPSRASDDEKKAFLDHIARSVAGKLDRTKPQLQPGVPNVLVIMAHNWLSHGYENQAGLRPLGFDLIEKAVRQALDTFQNPDLSCVQLYEWNYSKAQTIQNPYSQEASKLSEEELQLL